MLYSNRLWCSVEITELQAEIRSLAQAQIETTAILEEQEMQLAKERQTTEAWKHKYKVHRY